MSAFYVMDSPSSCPVHVTSSKNIGNLAIYYSGAVLDLMLVLDVAAANVTNAKSRTTLAGTRDEQE
jgi:hypothetical protein